MSIFIEEVLKGMDFPLTPMDYPRCISLSEYVHYFTKLTFSDLKLSFITTLGTVSKVHSKGIIFGNICPDNLLLKKNNAGNLIMQPAISDKCLKIIDEVNGDNLVFGRSSYLAPEIKHMNESGCFISSQITEKSDIYSVGMCFYLILTGSEYDKDLSDEQTSKVICGFQPMLLKMLSVDPNQRPSALEVIKCIRELEEDSDQIDILYDDQDKTDFVAPYPEHNIEFDTDTIISKGYVASAHKTMNGINGYEFIRANGHRQFMRVEMLIIMKMAKKLK